MLTTKIEETMWSYLSGLIDGEGHLALFRHYKKSNVSRRGYEIEPVLKITNMNKALLLTMQQKFGGNITQLNNRQPARDGSPQLVITFDLRFSPKEQIEMYPYIIPHLILKKEVAQIIYHFLMFRHTDVEQNVKEEYYKNAEITLRAAILRSKPWLKENSDQVFKYGLH